LTEGILDVGGTRVARQAQTGRDRRPGGPEQPVDLFCLLGPEGDRSRPVSVQQQEETVRRWYVKAFLQSDPSFRGPWLIEKRSVGEGVVAVAPYDTAGFHSPDWVGFEGEGSPQQYPGLSGLWAGVPYDFVNSGNFPPEVTGCLHGT
jgi:hypothetical protein